jgi:predicted amidophosphoribosyltransferase
MRITLPEVSIETEVLFRTRHTKEQTTLSQKERKENMRGAFSARDVSPGTRYILIDDVITTGATLFEASRAMQRAGATHITAIALAH